MPRETADPIDPQSLLNEAKCLLCGVAPEALIYVQIQLLIDLLHTVDPTADVSLDAILKRSSCVQCAMTPQLTNAVTVELLWEILEAL